MTKRRKRNPGIMPVLSRIERKCDRILAELFLMRPSLPRPDADETIERMHLLAKRMREMCGKDFEETRESLGKSTGSWK